ncbi:MAG: EVE domain-containing protein [Candidatus Bathyarchaeia archaeon]
MTTNSKYWIFSVRHENWKISREKKVWAVKNPNITKKVTVGDFLILYSTDKKAFLSILRIASNWYRATELTWSDEKSEGRIIYPYQVNVEVVKEGLAKLSELVPSLSFIENKSKPGVYLRGTPANFGRPIPELDFKIIDQTMANNPLPKDFAIETVTEETSREGSKVERKHTHDEVKRMIYEIGKFEGKISEMEYPIENLRLDVVWKSIPTGNPKWAFEVQMAGNFYEALTKLKHAWDKWNSKPCLITTEEYMNQAEWLLNGSFHEMKSDARIIEYTKIVRLHELLKDAHRIKLEIGL